MFGLLLLSECVVHVTQWISLPHRVTTNKGLPLTTEPTTAPVATNRTRSKCESLTTLFHSCSQISILDSKRGMNIGIFLKQFKK